jgi:hypothetical protein
MPERDERRQMSSEAAAMDERWAYRIKTCVYAQQWLWCSG